MRTVMDQAGERYLLLKRSAEAWLVRDPQTGTERHLPAAHLSECPGTSPLEAAAAGVSSDVSEVLTEPSPRALGLLAEIDRRGPISVRRILADYELCESDLHGLLTEFQAAGLIAEVEIGGERGYTATETLTAQCD
ncbi:MAG: hypothetical protein ABEH64_02945 [Salinirussus sp.]